jgi:hypothetical protein
MSLLATQLGKRVLLVVGFNIIGTLLDGATATTASDTVYTVIQTDCDLAKSQVERAEVEHYHQLAGRKHPDLAFEIEEETTLRPSNASPDFFINRKGRRLGLDVTDYAFSDRRAADARFEKVKESLASAYRSGRFRMGERMNIWIRFGKRDIDLKQIKPDLPELIDQLDRIVITPSIEAWANQSDIRGPAPYPLNQGGTTSSGAIEWGVESIIPLGGFMFGPQSDGFYRECKFQIKHLFVDAKSPSEIAGELDRIVAKHDKQKPPNQHIDELLIVAGGPDHKGRCLPGEAARARSFVDGGGTIAAPARLTRVVLDCWGADSLIVLFDREAIGR